MADLNEKVILSVNLDVDQVNAALVETKKGIRETKETLSELQAELDKAFTEKDADKVDKLTEQIVLNEASLRNLTTTQKNLQKQLDLNTRANTAQKGSYEQLLRQWQLADIKLKELAGTLARNADGQIILTAEYERQAAVVAQAKDAIDRFNITVNDGRTTVGQYDKALQPLKSEVKQLRETTEALHKTMAGLNALQQTSSVILGDNSDATKLLSNAVSALVVFQNLSNIRTGISASLLAAQSIQLGVNRAATASATAATGAFAAVQQFLQVQFALSAAAARAFAIAVAATGIGALVIGLGLAVNALIGYIARTKEASKATDDWKKAIDDATKSFDHAIDRLATVNDMNKKLMSTWETQIELARLRGASEVDLYQLQINLIDKQLDALQRARQTDLLEYTELVNKKKILTQELTNAIIEEAFKQTFAPTVGDISVKVQAALTEQQQLDAIQKQSEASKIESEQNITKELSQQLDARKQLVAEEETLEQTKLDFIASGTAQLRGFLKQTSAGYKSLFVTEKAAAIAQIVMQLQVEKARNAAANALLGAVGAALTTTQNTIATIRAGIAIATIGAQVFKEFTGFAGGGLTGKKITSADGKRIARSNGDNLLATVKTGEVILNEQQQWALGGPNTFKRIGVPGFSRGGPVPFADGGLASRFASAPVENQLNTNDLFNALMQSNFVVRVSEINAVQGKIVSVSDKSTI